MSSGNGETTMQKSRSRKRYEGFYRRLRERVRTWLDEHGTNERLAEYLLLAPDLFHLLVCLFFDDDVPQQQKTKLLGAILYFMVPFDLLPELLFGPVAYIDDIAVACYVLNSILSRTDPAVIRRHWAGEADLLETVADVLQHADDLIGRGLWERLRELFDRKRD